MQAFKQGWRGRDCKPDREPGRERMARAGGEETFVFISFAPTAVPGGVASRARKSLTMGPRKQSPDLRRRRLAPRQTPAPRVGAILGKLTLFH